MIILGVDTSLPLLSVALLRDDALIGALSLEGKGSRNEKLLPAIDWLLTEAAVSRTSIDLFAVTRGPGSFTGVRIGLATVQGLALVLGRPVCAMSTHEAIASSFDDDVVIADDAGRGEFYVSHFAGGRETSPPRLLTAAERAELSGRIITVAEFAERQNVAAGAARRAHRAAAEGDLDRFADATPIYVRLAEAEVKLQQKRSR
ncbi:MAG TPA: tRNA (adenosine(37)-N6)-threonylcarbamoyltransferase complex dimerization subunit type 1 TsaB [Thermoanaerobaculia bacterium]|nr:tRNA (adenosine(37)-N6)-threonylcarbamoyltransferase complex dimerization subunit type 1 TsaB [Thermoanaerobaculia bacterium]